ncbi:MAG: hypothetical protein WAW48_16870, partial [Azonexus sp.]
MISAPLPPLDRSVVQPSPGERLLNVMIVLGLHLLLLYAALYLSVKNELIELPVSLSVRLLPMLEERPHEAPPQPPPPKPQPPLRRPPVIQPEPAPVPVLAVNTASAAPAFVVAPQPPAPPVQAPVVP